jgi:hypothetical protein|tara:strand:- start:282 stop:569 length:288 start_codon:yes stop_codon:yes gene_type:complete
VLYHQNHQNLDFGIIGSKMISLKDFLNEGIPNYFRGYFDNVNSNLERLEKNVKVLIKDLGKDGFKKESVQLASLYKKHIIEFKVKMKQFEKKYRD